MAAELKHVTLELGPKQYEMIQKLMMQTSAGSEGAVLGRAVAIYNLLHEEQGEGSIIFIKRKDGSICKMNLP